MVYKFQDKNKTVIQTSEIYYTERISQLMIGIAFERDSRQAIEFLMYDNEKDLIADIVNITENKIDIV